MSVINVINLVPVVLIIINLQVKLDDAVSKALQVHEKKESLCKSHTKNRQGRVNEQRIY